MEAAQILEQRARQSSEAIREFLEGQQTSIFEAAFEIAAGFAQGGKMLVCGNGPDGIAAQYFSFLFSHPDGKNRPGLPAFPLVLDNALLTDIAVRYGVEEIFGRQIEVLGASGDILLVICSGGNVSMLLDAIHSGQTREMNIMGILSRDSLALAEKCHISILAPTRDQSFALELFFGLGNVFCQLTDYFMFENPAGLAERLLSSAKE